MFPMGPRRQYPRRPMPPQFGPPKNGTGGGTGSNLLAAFRTPEGNIDFDKIQVTAQHAKSIYDQVSPMITKFIKK